MRPLIQRVSLEELAALYLVWAIVVSAVSGTSMLLGYSIFALGVLAIALVLKQIGLIGQITLRKGPRFFDWMHWIVVLLYIAFIFRFAWDAWDIGTGSNLGALLLLMLVSGVAIFITRIRKTNSVEDDERTRGIAGKSARNGLIVLVWALLLSGSTGKTIFSDGTQLSINPIDSEKTLVAGLASFAVFLISLIVYRRSEFN